MLQREQFLNILRFQLPGKYNALARHTVRTAHYVREVEPAKMYHENGEEILWEIEGRLRDSWARAKGEARPNEELLMRTSGEPSDLGGSGLDVHTFMV